MEPTFFIIAILGCADAATDCRDVATVPSAFRDRVSCIAAQEKALDDNAGLDFPTIVAQCRPADRMTVRRLQISIPPKA